MSTAQFAVMVAVLFVVLPVLAAVNYSLPEVWWSLYYEWSSSDVRERFGFETGYFPHGSVCSDEWAVTSVMPRGYFDRLGVQVGDIPVRYVFREDGREHGLKMFQHGLSSARVIFYDGLRHPRGATSGFVFVPCGVTGEGGIAMRRTIVMFPRETALSETAGQEQ